MVDGVISNSNIKYYQCSTWGEGDSHGGDIDLANEITSGISENIFSNITDVERISGTTKYRKVYVRNENIATWDAIRAYISQFTPAANDEISIALGTPSGVQSVEGVGATYVSPDSAEHADALVVGSLDQNAYKAIWIKLVVTAAGDGYTGNSFKVACSST